MELAFYKMSKAQAQSSQVCTRIWNINTQKIQKKKKVTVTLEYTKYYVLNDRTFKIFISRVSFGGSYEKYHNLLKKPHQDKLEKSRTYTGQEQDELKGCEFYWE